LVFLKRVYVWDLTIPHFAVFRQKFKRCFEEIKTDPNNEFSWGEVATYIPPLAKADPNWFASTFCSTDGQLCEFGDFKRGFSI
jgi:glutaminase